jgi:hypothetical protein
MAMLCAISTSAKTYTISSGKWTDSKVWGNDYIGTIVKADDVVIITGQVTLTVPLVIEGKLQVERGASLVGMKDLFVSRGGSFINYGNTVVRSITNSGTITNHLSLEAMSDIQTTGTLENNSYMLAGNDFKSNGGNAYGRGGRIYANNEASVSGTTDLALGVSVLSVKKKE